MTLTTHRVPTTARQGKVHYPDSDGKPMAETDVHRNLMLSLISALRWRYRDDPLIYVSGNLLLYYAEGDPRQSTAPDCFVVKGVPAHDRRTYLLWEEGVAPCVAIELTSRSTKRQDTGTKRLLYASLGIREYFLFDPLEEYLRPPMQGYRLTSTGYVDIAPDPDGALPSAELGLRLARAGRHLRLWDPATGTEVMDDQRRAEAERVRAEAEHVRAEAEHVRAEAEHVRAEAERVRADAEKLQAEVERERADEAERRAGDANRRADDERARAEAMEAELARLRAQLGQDHGANPTI